MDLLDLDSASGQSGSGIGLGRRLLGNGDQFPETFRVGEERSVLVEILEDIN